MKVAIVICTEAGIEKYSLLLVKSVRQYGESVAATPIFSFSARPGFRPSQSTRGQLEALEVVHQDLPLNIKYPVPTANKPLVCAYAEQVLEADTLIFLDSDKVMLNEPDLVLPNETSIALRPVYTTNIGVNTLSGGINEDYWRTLYGICKVQARRTITTTVDEQEILQYFNSGFIVTRRSERLFSKWASNFIAVMESGVKPTNPFFIEQSTLSATVSAINTDVLVLPATHNYPIFWHDELPSERRVALGMAVSVHYHRTFDSGRWRSVLSRLACSDEGSSDRLRWLSENLAALDF